MTSSLPESIDGLYRFSSFSDAVSSQTSLSINPDTLWSKLNECDKCVFFRNMVSKSLYATDYNNANTDVKTDLFLKLKSQLLVWQDSSFEQFLKIEKEEDNFLESPLEVAEGAIKCKCGSERVFSFSKQTRSGDESTSVFALCSSCKSKWVL